MKIPLPSRSEMRADLGLIPTQPDVAAAIVANSVPHLAICCTTQGLEQIDMPTLQSRRSCAHPGRAESIPFAHLRRILATGVATLALAACQTPYREQIADPERVSRSVEAESVVLVAAPAESESTMPSNGRIVALLSPSHEEALALRDANATPSSLWQRIRRGFAIPLPEGKAGELLAVHERWYRDRPDHLRRVFSRARLYMHDIVEAVEQAGLPMEVALLPSVESAFQPAAVSSASADGLWQFIAPTARRYDLKQHLFLDERRNPRAATRAALRYLTDLRARYDGDMQLALAAYNCGEGCIDAHVRRARAKGRPGLFKDLQVNQETANYVPRLMALVKLVAEVVDGGQLEAYGLPPLNNAPYFVAIPVHRDLDVSLAAQLAGMSLTEFKALNPQHTRPLIVAAAQQEVLVPVERATPFSDALARHSGPLASWMVVRVRHAASPVTLARLHSMDAQTLMTVNRIAPRHVIKADSTLLVSRTHSSDDIAKTVMEAAVLKTVPAMVTRRVTVRKGDGWPEVVRRLMAQGYEVTIAELRESNPKVKLRPGQVSMRVPAFKTKVGPAARRASAKAIPVTERASLRRRG